MKHVRITEERGLPRKEFLDEFNQGSHYGQEFPFFWGGIKSELYFGPYMTIPSEQCKAVARHALKIFGGELKVQAYYDDSKSILKIQSVMELFSNFTCIGTACNYDDGLNLILKFQPDFVFLEVNPQVKSSNLSLLLINELHRYLKQVPKIIAISDDTTFAFDALKYDVTDFLIKPLSEFDLRKTFLRVEKNQVFENAPVENLPINFSETIRKHPSEIKL